MMAEEQGTWVSVTETKFGVGVTSPFSCATYILSWDASAKLTGLFVAVLPFVEVWAPTDTLFLLCGELGFAAISFCLLLLLVFLGGFTIFWMSSCFHTLMFP